MFAVDAVCISKYCVHRAETPYQTSGLPRQAPELPADFPLAGHVIAGVTMVPSVG